MKILITGVCGFVGSTLAKALIEHTPGVKIYGIDNFIRPGASLNQLPLKSLGVRIIHGDIRNESDLDVIPPVDWVIDAAANPSVLAGIDGVTSSRQLVEHNLIGTVNVLEFCKKHRAGFVLLSTSRVYSIPSLANVPLKAVNGRFSPVFGANPPPGLSLAGISEIYSTRPPVSLYGSTKLASEALALEYGETFGFPVWINRCGVLAGAGQFGRPDQGIFAYWLNSHLRRRPLKYIGFEGSGNQVRDCLHPRDLVDVLHKQFSSSQPPEACADNISPRIANFSGGVESAMSLKNLTEWCDSEFGAHAVSAEPKPRPFDIGWMVLDSSHAKKVWDWKPKTFMQEILREIAIHSRQHPEWLKISDPF